MAQPTSVDHSVEIEQVVLLQPRDDGRKGYYGPAVELLLMSDGTTRWRYEDDD